MFKAEIYPTLTETTNVVRIPISMFFSNDINGFKIAGNFNNVPIKRLYISFKEGNIQKGYCYKIFNGFNVPADVLFISLFNKSVEAYEKELKDLINIKDETLKVIKSYLTLVHETLRLINLTRPGTLISYLQNTTEALDAVAVLEKNLDKVCHGNYLNAIHHSEYKKKLHLGLLQSCVECLEIGKRYNDQELKDIINHNYYLAFNEVYPLYIYVAANTAYTTVNDNTLSCNQLANIKDLLVYTK